MINKSNATCDKLYNFIVTYIKNNGYPPSIEEMTHGIGFASKATTHGYLQKLIKTGRIETNYKGSSRAIRIPGYKFIKVK